MAGFNFLTNQEIKDKEIVCARCKSKRIKYEEIENSCDCGAVKHFKKTCLDCGLTSTIHRTMITEKVRGIGG